MGGICSSGSSPPEMQSQTIKQITLNNVLLTLVHGSPVTEDVDAVLMSVDSNLHAAGPVASGLLKAGGSRLDEAIRRKWEDGSSLKPGDVFMTDAGSLHAFHVIHIITPDPVTPETVHQAFANVLTVVGKNELESVSLSPLEVPETSISRQKQAELVFSVMAEFLRDKKLPRLVRIRLISADMGVVKAFETEFGKHFPKWIHSRSVALKQKKEE